MKNVETEIPELKRRIEQKRRDNEDLRKERNAKREIAAILEKRSNIEVNYDAPSPNTNDDLTLATDDPCISE